MVKIIPPGPFTPLTAIFSPQGGREGYHRRLKNRPFCHPKRSEWSQPIEKARLGAALRMTLIYFLRSGNNCDLALKLKANCYLLTVDCVTHQKGGPGAA
jgi:hypothetical protein